MSQASAESSRPAAVEIALRAAASVHGMRASAFVLLSDTTATYQRVVGGWDGVRDGLVVPREESVAARVLDGAPELSADAERVTSYLGTVEVTRFGVRSVVVVPVPDGDGAAPAAGSGSGPGSGSGSGSGDTIGLIVGLDPAAVAVDASALPLLRGLAEGLAEGLAAGLRAGRNGSSGGAGAVAGGGTARAASRTALRRTRAGWVVQSPDGVIRPVGDLMSAMVLADLLEEDLVPPARPRRPETDLNETDRLRLSVVQLEHALASRVVVEQAIGVLAERHSIRPRDAFERLRRTARGMGRRVHDLARLVVESAGDPRAVLPGELATRAGAGAGAGGAVPDAGSTAARPAPPGGKGTPPGGTSPGGPPRPGPPRPAPYRR